MASPVDFERRNADEWDLETISYQQPKSTLLEPKVFRVAKLPSRLETHPRARGNAKILRPPAPRSPVGGPGKAQTKSRIADRLPGERDNEAKAAWRKRFPPTGTYELPCGYDKIDTRLFRKDHAAKARGLERSPYLVLEQIGAQTGAYIEPPSKLSTRSLKIWGNEIQLQSATVALQNWVAHSQKRTHLENGKRWAKTNAEPSARKRAAIDKKMQGEALKQSFRRIPEDTEVLAAVGVFLSPSNECDVQAVLGQNLEAFDPIRVDCRCYIVFEEEWSAFKVLSNDVQFLREAMRRIRVAFCEMASRNSKPRRLYLVEPPTPEALRKEVKLEDQHEPPQWAQLVEKHIRVPGVVPTAAGPKPSPEDLALWNEKRLELSTANQQSQKRAILKVLADLRFYRGHIQMRVHFGIPVLLAYKKPVGVRHTFEELIAVLRMSQTRGELVKCIGNDELAAVLMSRCCQATNTFVPGDAMTYALEDIKPILSATFDFAGTECSGPIRLELDFKNVEDGEYEISAIRWLKNNTSAGQRTDIFGGKRQRKVLDSMTLDLDKKLGWQLEVATAVKIEASKVTQEMRDFVKLVHVEVSHTEAGQGKIKTHPKVRFLDISTLGMRSFVQQSGFQYLLVDSDYVFEVTKYEHLSQESGESVNAGLCKTVNLKTEKSAAAISSVPDVRWGASFYNSQWDTILKGQVDVEVGNVGNWLPNLDTFFPSDRISATDSTTDTGFEKFVGKVEAIMKLLTSE